MEKMICMRESVCITHYTSTSTVVDDKWYNSDIHNC